MTKLLPYATIQNTSGENAIAAGAAPNGAQMQGNPDAASREQDIGQYPPGPQVGPGQTLNAPLMHDTISRGNVPLNTQPSNLALAAPGTQSLLALLSSGQASLNQSNYGQPASTQSQPTGPGSSVTVPAAPIYIGD